MLLSLSFGLLLQAGNSPKTIRALKTSAEIRVDGVLDEDVWSQSEVISDFIQQEPRVDEPASERTEVRILVNDRALYFGVKCFDSDPSQIISRERRRDDSLQGDDRFDILLDTYHDNRNTFHFATNPLGTRYDALVINEGTDVNREWDERWWVEAKVGPEGWTLEVEIPLVTLRSKSGEDTWGLNLRRSIRRKNEVALWTAWSRDYTDYQASRFGHVTGMADVETGLQVRIKPYLLGGLRETDGSGVENASDVGLELAKFGITSGLVAEATINTDFAQVEVDQAVVNLTRFPLFFPEKREFFLEQAGLFEFSPEGRRGGGTVRTVTMYFSRRIGLTEDREVVPLLAGGKLTGRMGRFDLGLLNAQTGDFEDTPGSNYTVARLKRNILSRSNTGVFVTNRQSSEDGDFNRIVGGDINFTFFGNFDINGALARSFTSGVEGDEKMGRVKFNWFTDLFEVFAEHLYVGDDFQNDIGFVRRTGIKRSNGLFVLEPRPGIRGIRYIVFRNEIRYTTDLNNRLLTRVYPFQFTTRFQSGEFIFLNSTGTFEQLDEDFEITDGIVIPQGPHRFREHFFLLGTSPHRKLSATTRILWGSFFDGTRDAITFSPIFRPLPNFSTELDYEYNDIKLPAGDFTTHVVNSRFNFNLTNRWLSTIQAQYDSESDRLTFFLRLRFIYRPGDDLFVVFNQTNSVGPISDPRDWTFLVKFTRSWDF